MNADPAEIAKFSALAHRWWDPTSEFKPLHDINPLRLGYVAAQCGGLRERDVIDVGCGGGILTEALATAGARVTGIDLSEKALAVARLHELESGSAITYRCVSAEAMAQEMPRAFDVVTCMEMLEHVPQPASTVAACAALAKPGGTVVFSTINRTPRAYLFAVIGAEYVLKLLPKGTHEYARFLKPSEIAAWARSAGLSLVDVTGMSYNPLDKTYRLERDARVNYFASFRA